MSFDLEILQKLASAHHTLFTEIKTNLHTCKTNRDLYFFIDNYINTNNLKKAFPIGISVNNIIAHDSFHINHIVKFSVDDTIKIDVGLIELGNIIDSARTFIYSNTSNTLLNTLCTDAQTICLDTEQFIQNEFNRANTCTIQSISEFIYNNICSKNYTCPELLGGHTIEYGKVHGKHLILNAPITQLEKTIPTINNFIDSTASIEENTMFAIEIYLPSDPDSFNYNKGAMVQNVNIPVTHYQIQELDSAQMKSLNKDELKYYNLLKSQSNGLAFEYKLFADVQCKNQIVKSLEKKGALELHRPLEFVYKNKKSPVSNKIVQYEDCFFVGRDERGIRVINLTKNSNFS